MKRRRKQKLDKNFGGVGVADEAEFELQLTEFKIY